MPASAAEPGRGADAGVGGAEGVGCRLFRLQGPVTGNSGPREGDTGKGSGERWVREE